MNNRVSNYSDIENAIDMDVQFNWEEIDPSIEKDEYGMCLPSISMVRQRYDQICEWCEKNCKGKWYHHPTSVTFHFELAEDATLYVMFWGGARLTEWKKFFGKGLLHARQTYFGSLG